MRRGHVGPHGFEFRDVVAVGSTLLLLMFIIKTYGVAHYSLTTTTALLVATPSQVALGTVAIYAYFVMPAVALGTIWAAVRFRRRVRPPLWALIVVVAVIAALASPLKYLLWGLGLLVLAFLMELVVGYHLRRWADNPTRRRALSQFQGLSIVYLGAGALAALFVFSLDVPWVSAQVFEVTQPAVTSTNQDDDVKVDTARYFFGYVVSENEEWVTILNAETRYIMRVRQSDVKHRLTCHNEKDQLQGDRPLLEALKGHRYVSPNIDCRKVMHDLTMKPI